MARNQALNSLQKWMGGACCAALPPPQDPPQNVLYRMRIAFAVSVCLCVRIW
jgi:hypothetical protein